MSTTNERKIEHIQIINTDDQTDRKAGYFDHIPLIHRALPNLHYDDIDPSTVFLGKRLSFPLIISSMTGGDHALLEKINRRLATAAEETKVAMAVGSQRICFENPQANKSFHLRSYAPSIPLISNLGAVQLNYGFTEEHCQKAVDILRADGLYLHLNPLQEVIQKEGNKNFSSLLEKIKRVCQNLTVPLLVKEVGCGMMTEDISQLMDQGIHYIDIAGHGGTSWSRIEARRSTMTEPLGISFQDWGISTPAALYLAHSLCKKVSLIASGGVRTGLDMIKSMVLGAQYCGMAAPLLKSAQQSVDHVVADIEHLKKNFVTAMFLLGKKNVQELHGNLELFLGSQEHLERKIFK